MFLPVLGLASSSDVNMQRDQVGTDGRFLTRQAPQFLSTFCSSPQHVQLGLHLFLKKVESNFVSVNFKEGRRMCSVCENGYDIALVR
jgi:hypothetical protein